MLLKNYGVISHPVFIHASTTALHYGNYVTTNNTWLLANEPVSEGGSGLEPFSINKTFVPISGRV